MTVKVHINPENEDWLSEKNLKGKAEGKPNSPPKPKKSEDDPSVRVAERFRREAQGREPR